MPTFLETVVERTQADVAARKLRVPATELEGRLGPAPRGRPFSEGLIDEGISLIAEMKRASPSKGPIRPGASVTEVVRAYQEAGARAVSVLTEGAYFGGSLDDLVEARGACDLPLLRKDFVVDEYQLFEAVVAGADAVLLIVSALPPATLTRLHAAATALGLAVLVEVHDDAELDIALAAGARIVGVNNRDLRTLAVDTRVSERLAARMPAEVIAVSESGLRGPDDVARMQALGYRAFLIGERLMTSDDPARDLRHLTGAEAAA